MLLEKKLACCYRSEELAHLEAEEKGDGQS